MTTCFTITAQMEEAKMFYDKFDRSFFHFHFHSITEGGPSAGADLQGALHRKMH